MRFRSALTGLAIVVSTTPGIAQTTTGRITGSVRDATSAVIAQAAVAIRDVNSNRAWVTRTDASGAYSLSALPPATYRVSVSLAGFKTVVAQPVRLDVNQVVRLDLVLELGSLSEVVHVEASRQVLQT